MFALKMIVTYRCNSMCHHCRFRSGPNLDGAIPTAKAKLWVEDLRDHFDLERLVLYGGEPTLYLEEMCEIARFAYSKGIDVHVETNCSWATTVDEAAKFLIKLRDLNPEFLFSFDGFHARCIPFERVKNAISAAKKLGMPYSHDVALMDNIDAENEYDKLTKNLMTELADEGNLGSHVFYRVFYTGRAAEKLAEGFTGEPCVSPDFYKDFLPGFRRLDQKCVELPWYLNISHRNTNVLDVDPYGWVSFGCGIAIGNANDSPITKIVADYDPWDHPIISILMREGPIGLTRMPEARDFLMKKRYVEKCHLCQDVRNCIRSSFPDMLAPSNFYF